MNSIADLYGKKGAKIPMPQEARIPLPQSTELHPAAQHAAVIYSEALMELDRLRRENEKLKNDLEVERRAGELCQKLLIQERALKESYMRYAVQIKTDLSHIVDIAVKANARAKEHASTREDAMSNVEEAVREAVQEGYRHPEAQGHE